LEVNAPAAGQLGEILVKDGETVEPGALLGSIVEAGAGAAPAKKAAPKAAETKAESRSEAPKAASPAKAEAPAQESSAGYGNHGEAGAPAAQQRPVGDNGPAVAKLARESGVDPSGVNGSGKDGRVTKGDMLGAIAKG
ncbi:dihydrolipoamide succinyltransferase, partial [Salmonella enterica subsp. enterica serovar Anatum]|uniref:E3 binding domain-containing protein n=1 Tax=Salmonella enterica TaxID=28901 RepID=UPI0019FDE07A